jgi:putative tryptophan/tyrosine transport system substrate-binding protein
MPRSKASMKKLGFLNSASSNELGDLVAAFHRGMNDAGFVEDENVEVAYQWGKHDSRRLPDLARELVEAGIHVLAATGGLASAKAAVEAAKSAAQPIRVVFVASYNPGKPELDLTSGNVTGVNTSTTESLPVRLQLANELMRGKKSVALLVNGFIGQLEIERSTAVPLLRAGTKEQLEAAFTEAKKAGHTVVVGADAFFTSRQKQIVVLAKKHGVPTVYPWRQYVDRGGLMSYGPSLPNAYRQAGIYVGQVLGDPNCTKQPALQPICFEHVINLKTAKRLKLEIPHGLLARTTDVVA